MQKQRYVFASNLGQDGVMRLAALSVLAFVLTGAPLALADDTEPSAIEFSISSNPERFGDDLEIVRRDPQDRVHERGAQPQSSEAPAAEELAADEGERVSWGNGEEEKDKRSPQH